MRLMKTVIALTVLSAAALGAQSPAKVLGISDAGKAALTAQMNPHLLFNALNTVASLIQSDPSAAEDVTVRLSELYRGILSSSQNAAHSLSREIEKVVVTP